ncbi:MAG: hypothetical protein ACHREM_18690 [Polyangiales bacterium]
MRTNRSFACTSLFALSSMALVACGGSSPSTGQPTDGSAGDDADDAANVADVATETATEAGSETASATYPAFKIDAPQIVTANGPLLKAAKIVPITWATDPDAAKYVDFVQKLGASSYWSTAVGEYGIGPTTSAATDHIVLTSTQRVFSDADIDAYVSAQLSDLATSKWPAPTAGSLYVLFMPPGMELQLGGGGTTSDAGVAESGTDAGVADASTTDAGDTTMTDPNSACVQGVGGYHSATVLADNTTIVSYAVLPHCPFGDATLTDFDFITAAASHEIAEASTDPIPSDPTATSQAAVADKAAYNNYDTLHYAWSSWQARAVENGDDCEFYGDSFVKDGGFGYAVQRLWSNASAAAGHSPCLPIFDTSMPYYNVVPLTVGTTTVNVRTPGTTTSTPTTVEGINIKVGTSATFNVGYYSDGPMDAWSLQAIEGGSSQALAILNPQPGDPTPTYYTTLTVDHPTGQNGDQATIHVTVNTAPPRNRVLITLVSADSAGKHHHYWPVLVTTN